MSVKTLSWILFAAMALGGVLLLNYWASFQLLSTLVYTGVVAALLGLANLAIPFRFMGVSRRAVGALGLAGGVGLALVALHWPAATTRVAQPRTRLDDVMPEYQFSEIHTILVHARPEQVMHATRQSTFGDMTSLATLLKVRGAAIRTPAPRGGDLQDKRVLDAFTASGYLLDGSDHEIVLFGAANVREQRRPDVRTAQQFVDYRERGSVKMAFDFRAEEAGDGWSVVSTETRVMALDDATRSGTGRYWRLIVPGSGLLRRQWLDGIKRRAESADQGRRASDAQPRGL
ncbi:MAG TPA: hypothetical protein VF902_02550 [Coriobacteriia bacterium]